MATMNGLHEEMPAPGPALEAERRGGDEPRHQTLTWETAAKLIDLRGVAKPPTFGGAVEQWRDFKFKFLSTMSMLGLSDYMEYALTVPEENLNGLTGELQVQTRFLYNILVQLTQNRALNIVRAVTGSNGFSAWRRLVREDEPDSIARHVSMLMNDERAAVP